MSLSIGKVDVRTIVCWDWFRSWCLAYKLELAYKLMLGHDMLELGRFVGIYSLLGEKGRGLNCFGLGLGFVLEWYSVMLNLSLIN